IRVAADMMSIRKRNGTWHGLVVKDLVLLGKDDGPADDSVHRSLVVERVEANSPAARLGLQRGDVVVQAADQRVACGLDLGRALLPHGAGEKVPLVVRRNGKDERLELVVQAVERPAPAPAEVVWRRLGVRLSPVNAEQVSRTNPKLHGGLAVVEVRPEGAGA